MFCGLVVGLSLGTKKLGYRQSSKKLESVLEELSKKCQNSGNSEPCFIIIMQELSAAFFIHDTSAHAVFGSCWSVEQY